MGIYYAFFSNFLSLTFSFKPSSPINNCMQIFYGSAGFSIGDPHVRYAYLFLFKFILFHCIFYIFGAHECHSLIYSRLDRASILCSQNNTKLYCKMSRRRVYRNFGAFPSAGLNRCFSNQKKKIFSLFCQSIPAKDIC